MLILTLAVFLAAPQKAAAAGRVLSGEAEYGEKYTTVFIAPEESGLDVDDEDYDRYRFRNAWLQYEQPVAERLKIALRTQQTRREYDARPQMDNQTTFARLRLAFEPNDGWAIWPTFSYRRRDYDERNLDNDILTLGTEVRYRWGVRNNVRFGIGYDRTSYAEVQDRDREGLSLSAHLEKPINEQTTLRVGSRFEKTSFQVQDASHENAVQGSGSIGFRYEF